MRCAVRTLSAHRFRNLDVSLELDARPTVLVGPNGAGKTSLLEAAHLLLTLRPLRPGRSSDLVQAGADEARIAAHTDEPAAELEMRITERGRRARRDDKQQPAERYLSGLCAVSFTPDDLWLIKGGPDGRRRALDRAAFGRHPAYLTEARAYAHALRARNRL